MTKVTLDDRLFAEASSIAEVCTIFKKQVVDGFANWGILDLKGVSGFESPAAFHRNPGRASVMAEVERCYRASPRASLGVYKAVSTNSALVLPVCPDRFWAPLLDFPDLERSSYICAPIGCHGRNLGVLLVFSAERTFCDVDLAFAAGLAALAGVAIDRLLEGTEKKPEMTDFLLPDEFGSFAMVLTPLMLQSEIIARLLKKFKIDGEASHEIEKVLERSDNQMKKLVDLIGEHTDQHKCASARLISRNQLTSGNEQDRSA